MRTYIRASKKAVYFSLADPSFDWLLTNLEEVSVLGCNQNGQQNKTKLKKKTTLNSGKAWISENIADLGIASIS